MNWPFHHTRTLRIRPLLLACCALLATPILAQAPPPADFPGPFGQGGPGRGMQQEEMKLLKKFDKNNDRQLDLEERKAARQFIQKEKEEGRIRGRFGPRGARQEPGTPGQKLSPADVKSYPDTPLYDTAVIRTFFLEFETSDWESELSDFKNTDVEVPARLIVDGKTCNDVGVHFRGMSSFAMVGEGRKRSFNLSLDWRVRGQNVGGYRTLNLLNSHSDPSFLRAVLFYQIAREYGPAPKASFARVAVNGESWGLFVNVEQFNKDFAEEWFGNSKGVRWKVPGSPGGRGSLAYLGEDPAEYRKAYEIKSKDTPEAWQALINLCKVLNETPPETLEAALEPILDVNGALKFLALDNALINNDGYWVRTSDYAMYQDDKGRFHLIPQDVNETFTTPGGPGFGRRGGPGQFLSQQMFEQADTDSDKKITREEFNILAKSWFLKLDPENTGTVRLEQFTGQFEKLLPFRTEGQPGPGPGRFPPAEFVAPAVFAALDTNGDEMLTNQEMKQRFGYWFTEWDREKSGALSEDGLRAGLGAVLPMPGGGPRRGFGGPGGPGRDGPAVKGVELDPLVAAADPNKPLISKLLAVPALRERYLAYVRDIAETWLDWNKLGPIATRYHELIAPHVMADTRKLDSDETFERSLDSDSPTGEGASFGRAPISLKAFADQRRAYLLKD